MAISLRTHQVGFAGLGNLGRPMAARLASMGWNCTVWDPQPGKSEALRPAAARVAEGPIDLRDCAVLVLAVPDDEAVRGLLEGPDGWLAGEGDRTVVVHSTVLPETAVRLSTLARERGVRYLDAPVSGGAERAEQGELTIMVGGDPADVEHAEPLLRTVGSSVVRVGPPGAGAATKLANQLMMFAALAGVYEALDLVAAHGVAEDDALAVVATGTGDSWVARHWGFFDRTAAAYEAGGTPRVARPWSKDLAEIVAAARAADVRVPVAGLLAQLLADRVEEHAALAAAGAAAESGDDAPADLEGAAR
jgi:3-hydroxyisobutyrate dehydrogenase